MERFRIKDFSTAFTVGIERLVLEYVKPFIVKGKDQQVIELANLTRVIKSDIFVKLLPFLTV